MSLSQLSEFWGPPQDAVVFSGGSDYGEETVTAVATGLKDDGERSITLNNLATVTGAIINDFAPRLNEIYPDKRLAQAALHALRPGVFPLGAQGAGRMATQGGFFGCYAHSGQGAAFRQLGQTKIAAFVVVNASGAVTDRAGIMVKCQRAKSWSTVTKTSQLLQQLPDSLGPDWKAEAVRKPGDPASDKNTSIGLVVTNEALDYAALQRLAVQVHTSMARAIQPFSTLFDGDVLFAASTQEVHNPEFNSQWGGLSPVLGAIAAETMWDAILASVPKEHAFVPSNVRVEPTVLARYTGEYLFGSAAMTRGTAARLSVKLDHDRLLIQSMSDGPIFEFKKEAPVPVLPASETDFYVDGRYHTRIEFIEDSQGHVLGAVLNPGPWAQKGKKVPDPKE
jgi:L-aminopeptidase/D-esterase-like protein